MDRASRIAERLRDERGGRVAFLSHCLLNENVRYPGGAFRAAGVEEVVLSFLRAGIGIVQMPCPEQRAWGGVRKRLMLAGCGSGAWAGRRTRAVLLAAFTAYTRLRFRLLARRVAGEIADYLRSGFEVVGVVGIGGSPSCGVRRTVDLRRSLDVLAEIPATELRRDEMNERAIVGCFAEGEGLFAEALRREIERRGLRVPFLEHDLADEMRGEPSGAVYAEGTPPC